MRTAAPRAALACLPGGPGVYRFRDARGRALYVGRAVDLRRRVTSYWSDLRGRRHLLRMVPQIVGVEAVACDSAHEAAWLERNLLEKSKPRWNRARGGAEVPVYIRLDSGQGLARLSVVHSPGEGGEVFGPYLGGTQARLAVSALDRVLPLRYTDKRLSGGERDLARARGVEAADREVLLATATAVLRRRPDAVEGVKARLVVQRDKASAGLAFELAARVQEEIEAIDWIVAEQKVTLAGGGDCDIYGWAGGLLVHFGVRRGRLRVWAQRACEIDAAQRFLDRTPEGWRPFAARGAELAWRLSEACRPEEGA